MQLSDLFEPYKGEVKEVTIGPSGEGSQGGGEKHSPSMPLREKKERR